MVSLKTKFLTEEMAWLKNFTENCSKWSTKRQSQSANHDSWIANWNLWMLIPNKYLHKTFVHEVRFHCKEEPPTKKSYHNHEYSCKSHHGWIACRINFMLPQKFKISIIILKSYNPEIKISNLTAISWLSHPFVLR